MDNASFSARLSIRVVGNGCNEGYCFEGDTLCLIQEENNTYGLSRFSICNFPYEVKFCFSYSSLSVVQNLNRYQFNQFAGESAIKVENENNPGVIIGRIKRKKSDDEECMSSILDNVMNIESCTIICTAAMESDRSYRSSTNGFVAFIDITCASEFELKSVLSITSKYNVTVENSR